MPPFLARQPPAPAQKDLPASVKALAEIRPDQLSPAQTSSDQPRPEQTSRDQTSQDQSRPDGLEPAHALSLTQTHPTVSPDVSEKLARWSQKFN